MFIHAKKRVNGVGHVGGSEKGFLDREMGNVLLDKLAGVLQLVVFVDVDGDVHKVGTNVYVSNTVPP